MVSYANQYRVDASFEETINAVTDALSAEGFGVLADIDMQAAFESKLGEEFEQYRILGACNPALAFEALDVEFELGALLPCNVVVYEDEAGVGVNVVDPDTMLTLADDEEGLEPIVEEVRAGLTDAMAAVPDARPVAADE